MSKVWFILVKVAGCFFACGQSSYCSSLSTRVCMLVILEAFSKSLVLTCELAKSRTRVKPLSMPHS